LRLCETQQSGCRDRNYMFQFRHGQHSKAILYSKKLSNS